MNKDEVLAGLFKPAEAVPALMAWHYRLRDENGNLGEWTAFPAPESLVVAQGESEIRATLVKPALQPEPRNLFAPGDLVRHVRSGNTYRVDGRCTIEATLADCYLYRGHDGVAWVRPVGEMEDGRFVRVAAAETEQG